MEALDLLFADMATDEEIEALLRAADEADATDAGVVAEADIILSVHQPMVETQVVVEVMVQLVSLVLLVEHTAMQEDQVEVILVN